MSARSTRDRTSSSGAVEPTAFRVSVPAQWGATSASRRALRAWLRSWAWPSDDVDDALLAVNEAVSNSIEHGYLVPEGDDQHSGEVVVEAEVIVSGRERRIVFVIRDRGRWRTDQHDTDGIRSRGLTMMRAVMARVDVRTGPGGTEVRMTTEPVDLPDRDDPSYRDGVTTPMGPAGARDDAATAP